MYMCFQAQERQRSLTDPAARKATLCVPGPITPVEMLELSKATLERKRSQTHSDSSQSVYPLKNEFRRLSLTEQKTDSRSLSEDTAYDSDSESIYDIPRPVPRKLSVQFSEDDDDCDVDSPDEHVYQPMRSLQNSFDSEKSSMEPAGLSQNPLDEQESMDHSSEQDSSDYVKKNLTVPTAHLKKHLDLQEVGERLCVSKWKGPVDIGCVFHHGDHIIDINGFQPANKEFFFQMLDRFTKEEVDLVVVRNKKAGVFHVEGCNCRASWEERHLEEERNT
ncbi:uncharacterized protein [Pyxicephalus adspersus]|uniref:uncharacterized protein isoform X2 n=1 Tax=Pyxicephalus adspersus TaxID=30357 RepID=UPI003B599993